MMKRTWPLALAWALAACASPAVVFVGRGYDPARVRRVALVGFQDFSGLSGSGEIAAATFEKYLLLGNYNLVERRRVNEIIKEQGFGASGAVDPATIRKLGKLLGVDALVLGSLTDFSNVREHTVMVDVPLEQSEPIYGRVVTTQQSGDTTVRTVQKVVTGYSYVQTNQLVPETQTVPARVGLSVRLVDVESGSILWSGSGSSEGDNLASAAEEASSKIMQAVLKQLKK